MKVKNLIALSLILATLSACSGSTPTSVPIPDTKVEPTTEIKVELTTEAKVEPTTEAKVEPTTETKVEPTTEAKVEPTTETKVEPTTEAYVEPTTEIYVEPTTEVKVEPTTEVKVEPTTEIKVEPITEAYVEPTTEAYIEPTTEAKVEPTTEVYVEPTTEVYVEPTTETYVEPTTEVKVEPTTETYVEPTTEAYVEPTTEAYVKPTIEVTPEMLIEKIITNVPRKSRLDAAAEYYDAFGITKDAYTAGVNRLCLLDNFNPKTYYLYSLADKDYSNLINSFINFETFKLLLNNKNELIDESIDYDDYWATQSFNGFPIASSSSDLYNDLDYIQNNYMYRVVSIENTAYASMNIEGLKYYFENLDHIPAKSALLLGVSYVSYDIYDSSNIQELYYSISSLSSVKNKTNTYEKNLNNYNKVKDNIHLNHPDVSTSYIQQDIYFLDKNPNGAILVLTINCQDYKFYFTTFDKETNTGDLFYTSNFFFDNLGVNPLATRYGLFFATQEDKDLFNKKCLVSSTAYNAFQDTGNDMFLNPDLNIDYGIYWIADFGGDFNLENIQYIRNLSIANKITTSKSAEHTQIDYVIVDGQAYITEFYGEPYWKFKQILGIDLNEYITIPENVLGLKMPPLVRPAN